jgi:hypothetical protein
MTSPSKAVDVVPPNPAEAELGNNTTDRITAIARALIGAVPGAGSVLAEVITNAIPKQRLDRIADFVVLLAQEVEKLSAAEKLSHSTSLPLIEEGISQASRAFSDERRKFLAKCVAKGVDADDMAKLGELKLLQLLGELGDDDLLLLDANNERDGWAKLRALQPPMVFVNDNDEVRAREELHRASYRKLVSLGLLNFSMNTDELGLPKYERTGELQGHHFVSSLGRQLLVRAGLAKAEVS